MKIKFFISPLFLEKYYLLKGIRQIINNHSFNGSILDVGCGSKPYKYLFPENLKYTGIDSKKFSINNEFHIEKPDLYFNLNYYETLKLPFKNSSYDNTVCFEVLEHHKNPYILIQELVRVTRKSGLILISVPFIGGIHEDPYDYQRYTEYGVKQLFSNNGCELIDFQRRGSVFSVLCSLWNEYLCNFANKKKSNYYIAIFLYMPFLIIQYSTLILDKIFPSEKILLGYIFLFKKIK